MIVSNSKQVNQVVYGPTTGACAAAAAVAALRFLINKKSFTEITIVLPCEREWNFKINKLEVIDSIDRIDSNDSDSDNCSRAIASIIKPYNSDYDCTIGAEIVAEVILFTHSTINRTIEIEGGVGVAKVTKSGLGLEVGSWAINPIPKKHIKELIEQELTSSINTSVKVIISVPEGEELAKKTINERLGLVGGISILGITGLVMPYSVDAYKECISSSLSVAYTFGGTSSDCKELVFTTGGRTEFYAKKLNQLQHLNGRDEFFIQVADFLQYSIDLVANDNQKVKRVEVIHLVAMMGKLSKIANIDNNLLTHVNESDIDTHFLAKLVSSLLNDSNDSNDSNDNSELINKIKGANTAREVLEITKENGIDGLPLLIAKKAHEAMVARIKNIKSDINIHVYFLDYSGNLLAFYKGE
ncbi:MAG: cobalt-precorrin-5B (C(1))-methyltransferase [Oligoflexia bacterium]|nr:cobalt-precorrin-5B (C(1))-methyltransferase [Oligoflexia bacterium]